jgi:hypothetical protein
MLPEGVRGGLRNLGDFGMREGGGCRLSMLFEVLCDTFRFADEDGDK